MISELAMGEIGHVSLRDLIVTPEQDCFLDAKATLQEPGLLKTTVRRDEDGFHIVLPGKPDYSTQSVVKGMDVLAIASIAVSKREMVSPVG
jgi:hypothetical protein